jgi:hypothetical protein
MATLTAADYRELRKACYANGAGKEEFKALASLPNEGQLLACFQVLEDWVTNDFAGLKTDMQTALGGVTITTPHAKKIIAAFLLWKIAHL